MRQAGDGANVPRRVGVKGGGWLECRVEPNIGRHQGRRALYRVAN
jgi:hypothetical protein